MVVSKIRRIFRRISLHRFWAKLMIVASNASVYTNAKTRYFHRPGNAWFLLVEALPQSPENTGLCSGNAAEKQRLRDFAIAKTERQESLAKS